MTAIPGTTDIENTNDHHVNLDSNHQNIQHLTTYGPQSPTTELPATSPIRPDDVPNDLASTTDPFTSPSSSSRSKTSAPMTAAIPTRTSSSNAITNGDNIFNLNKSPHKHWSLNTLPEEQERYSKVDEQEWIAQGRSLNSPSHPPTRRMLSNADSIQAISADLTNGHGQSWTTEKEKILRGPFDYLESHPGKDVRTQLIAAFNNWLQVPSASLEIITRVVTMLHTSSLLIDDVEDNSQLRRGVPVAHSIFGTAQTINSANYVYFCALQELLTLNNPEVVRIYSEELVNLHRGQGMDLFWRDTLTCPTEDDYLEMVGNKTGGLFRLAIKLMCAESPTQKVDPESSGSSRGRTDYVPLVNTVGLLFQILDDYRNLSDTTYTRNKGLCEDLTEGKFSFPIIHAIRTEPSNMVLINILKQKPTDDDVKKYAVAYMERMGSFTYTRRVLRGLTKKALALVDEVDAGQGKAEGVKSILEKLRIDKHSRESRSA